MNLYISDLHFGHKNVIGFDHRPFADVEEMDNVIIELWNGRVQPDDHVYIVGDFCHRNEKSASWYLQKLRGHKHLIIGNHDNKMMKDENNMKYFEPVDKMLFVDDLYEGEKVAITLCHFPMAEWHRYYHGQWHIYGHIHNRREETYEIMRKKDHALNAAACINNYTPCSFRELVENNKRYREDGNV